MPTNNWSDEEVALISAIHAEPRSDVPRLAYAEWLAKNGKPEYAEFIRLQCQQPYIGVVYHRAGPPHVSHTFDMPWGDQEARARVNRLLALVPHAYRVDGQWWEEHFRGLPLLQEEIHGVSLDFAEELLTWIGPAARLDLAIHTVHLAKWLSHPVMVRVDILHIWPELPLDAVPDADGTMNSHYDAFWAENIPILASSPIIDRLYELNPCGCCSTGDLTARSVENMARCRELLEPRVYVEHSY